jgi:energy-coupling factor transporter transmembrane protein EcfT
MEISNFHRDISLQFSMQARAVRPTTARKPGNTQMDWVPIVFITFKVLVFGTGMFFAIKWHHDQAKKDKQDRDNEK